MTQIKFLATGQSPDYYTFSGETVTAHRAGESVDYDFSGMPEGALFTGADGVGGVPAIRHAERTGGELRVTLCQEVGPGHWQESEWIASGRYSPDAIYVKRDTDREHSGTPWAKTRNGREGA